MKLLITGGAGFVGSSLAMAFRNKYPKAEIDCLDNLHRRGSELNLPRFKQNDISFVHGDIRRPDDLADLPKKYDFMIEASAEPSVHAGTDGSPMYLLETNLVGAVNCFEFARNNCGGVIFLSSSRVYSLQALKNIGLTETDSRFVVAENNQEPGVTDGGITEDFAVNTARSLYGTTKLAAEYLLQEYCETFGLKAVMNRCGVIAGPGQFGKVDQGVLTLWVANRFFNKSLKYTGFGGTGKQVRDLLHPHDLFRLIETQMNQIDAANGQTYNAGGGTAVSTSMQELTKACQAVTGCEIEITSVADTAKVDIPYYVSNCRKAEQALGWKPEVSVQRIVEEIHTWLKENEPQLQEIFN